MLDREGADIDEEIESFRLSGCSALSTLNVDAGLPVDEVIEYFDDLREDRKTSVSCSDMRDGPGTGGRGEDGGPDGGGFPGVGRGDCGTNEGGRGKDSRRECLFATVAALCGMIVMPKIPRDALCES